MLLTPITLNERERDKNRMVVCFRLISVQIFSLYIGYIITLYNILINDGNIHLIDIAAYKIRQSGELRYFLNFTNEEERNSNIMQQATNNQT
jgi:hypothetical protein